MTAHKKLPLDPFLRAAKEPELVVLPPAKFICVEGAGAPEESDFQAAVGALYSVAYTMKFAAKKAGGPDLKVAPLEALWWANVPRHEFDLGRTPRTAWRWKAMIRVPASVTKAQVEAAKKAVIAKRGDHEVSKVVLEKF
ncbi:MAG: hypothetical protein H6Q90_5797, partial [Deltaproteobacteria bacterium]|nr:hypothetical protein [Deltaproteobacteria bacterium]